MAKRKYGNDLLPMQAMILLVSAVLFMNCNSVTSRDESIKISHIPAETAHPDSIVNDKQIPVLCYHQVRDWKSTDSKSERVYITPVAVFDAEMQTLHDSGYHSISPDQLIGYIVRRDPLPIHPVLITFDDATASQYENALPELNKVGYKATFFIMTVVLGHKDYMSRADVAALSQQGHVIGCHTWDHHNVSTYTESDWVTELEKPTAELEKITGKPIKYFAYPFGLWNKAAADTIKAHGYTAAFQLWGKNDDELPLYTIRRTLVSGTWNPAELLKAIHRIEKQPEPITQARF